MNLKFIFKYCCLAIISVHFFSCNKISDDSDFKSLPNNEKNKYVISEEQAASYVKKMIGTLISNVETKGTQLEYTATTCTDYITLNLQKSTKSGDTFLDIEKIPIYTIELTEIKSSKKTTCLFIGDKRIRNPFVAFSENKKFDLSKIPDFDRFINENLKNYIQAELKRSSVLTKAISPPSGYRYCYEASQYRLEWEQIVGPLITKISWDQQIPENDSLPFCQSLGVNMPAGCVSVAISQILSYHKYPTAGSYIHPVSGLNTQTSYDWDLMTSIEDAGQSSNVNLRSQVANLHAEVGHKASIEYFCNSSSTNILSALSCLYKLGYSNAYTISNDGNFISTIRNEIDNNRPVYMKGTDSNVGGHTWVIDGYKAAIIEKGTLYYCFSDNNYSNDPDLELYECEDLTEELYFRCKLGWGPYYDVYFATPLLSVAGYDFSSFNMAIVGISL